MTNGNSPETNPQLDAFARQTLGSGLRIEDRSRGFGRKSITWRIEASGGEAYYLKQHEHRTHFHAEVVAYKHWVPLIPKEPFWHSPELVADSQELGAIIMTDAPGQVLDESDVSDDDRSRMFWIAGWLSAQIHQLDVEPTEAGAPRRYGPDLWRLYIEKATPYLDTETLSWFEQLAEDESMFSGLELVPTHSDSSPRNWLIDSTSGRVSLGLIDWERARPSYWLEDLQRLVYDDWVQDPRLRTEYLAGYGRVPTDEEERQMRLICLANALGTVSWAIEHGDTKFAEFGRQTIATIRQELGEMFK